MVTLCDNEKLCENCKYWCGRKFDFTASFLEVIEEKGKCAGPEGSFIGVNMWHDLSCNQWEECK